MEKLKETLKRIIALLMMITILFTLGNVNAAEIIENSTEEAKNETNTENIAAEKDEVLTNNISETLKEEENIVDLQKNEPTTLYDDTTEENRATSILGTESTTEENQENEQEVEMPPMGVAYDTHIQDKGWEKSLSKKDGQSSGTSGQSKRLEGIHIKLYNAPTGVGIKYQTHVENVGWQNWKTDGALSGTTGKSYRLEGIKIELTGTQDYSVMYRVHVQNIGWQSWRTDGEIAGTSGQALRLEAIEIKIVEKDKSMHISYNTHIQDIGWQGYMKDGDLSGTSGQSKRLEAIKIKATNLPAGVQLKYKVHVQDIGWQTSKTNDQIAGTSGQGKRLEAIKIKLEGTEEYSVQYRVHVQDIGWQSWCYDYETAGTAGLSKRLEAIQIKIVPKISKKLTSVDIESPNGTIYNTSNTIKGWVMTTVTGTSLKVYIDNKEIGISRVARQDVLNKQKGYGNEEVYNKVPGFQASVDFSKYSIGAHEIKMVVKDSAGSTLKEYKKTFNIKEKVNYSTGYYGVTGLKAAGKGGMDLKYFKYGEGPNVFFATFAIHGWEDKWGKDGLELVQIAEQFFEKLKSDNDVSLAKKWTIYIFPGVNNDGLTQGYTNNGPGRTTLYSKAPGHKGIDLNRCWQVGNKYTRYTDNRNYNGTAGFQAYEAEYLRNFLLQNKSTTGQTVLVDLHGWTQQLIGDPTVCSYYATQFPRNDKSAVGRYGEGYLINWARSSLGRSGCAAKSALVELPNENVTGHQSVVNQNFAGRYINATLSMLRNL